jgi:hypothetical protein
MKRIVSIAATVMALSTLLSPPAARAADDIKALEQAMWEAWAKHDLAVFEARLTEDHVHIASSGMIVGKAANLADLKNPCEVKSWKLGDMREQQLGSDAVLLAYEADQDGTCGGQKLAPHLYVTVVWKKVGGKWMNASYHESSASK